MLTMHRLLRGKSWLPLTLLSFLAACGGSGNPSSSATGSSTAASAQSVSAAFATPKDIGCGADIGGWTVPVPSAANTGIGLTDTKQPGSRLHYISAATGSDDTGKLYFWDGSQIIDATGKSKDANGVAYGTDAMNPSAAVKAFRRWAYVGPRLYPDSDIGTPERVGGPTTAFRYGFPDWWMFKRGETYDLANDLTSFARQTDPNAEPPDSSLAVPGGRSPTERQIVGAYGDICQPRPHFIRPIANFVASFKSSYTEALKNVAYLSLHFDGHERAPGAGSPGVVLLGQSAASTDILFEDVWFDAASINITTNNAAQVTLRRSLVTDNYAVDGSHVQGIYYGGAREGMLRIEESILMRNGFSRGDPKTTAWPPSGAQSWDIYNRNMYISGETNSMKSGIFDSVSMLGASGDQFRTGARVERNFFYQGSVGVGAQGGYPDSDGPTGTVIDNVLQKFVGSGTDDNRGQPGWGFILGGGAYAVEMARNVVTGAQYTSGSSSLDLRPIWYDCDHTFAYATRSNNIHDNIFDSGTAPAAITLNDGATASQGCYNYAFRGVKNNSITNNVLVNADRVESEYLTVGTAVGSTSDTILTRNSMFTDRANAAAALGWQAPNRTLKTYLQARGIAVSSIDGFPEYFALATQQRRGQWKADWTSKALVNHVRGGFNMALLADTPMPPQLSLPEITPLVFDASWYLNNQSDFDSSINKNNLALGQKHWLEHGIGEGRQGNLTFSSVEYKTLNPDLAGWYQPNDHLGRIRHYVSNGRQDGRCGLYAICLQVFDAAWYLNNHADLLSWLGAGNLEGATKHWIEHGLAEGRRGSPDFSAAIYLRRYTDLQSAYGSDYRKAVIHYLLAGVHEGRSGR